MKSIWTPALTLLAALVIVTPAQAQYVCDGVNAACSLDDLGSGRYRFTFVVTNGSPLSNVIFKWEISTPHIPAEWVTVSFDLPPGWSANHPDSRLDFQIPNGDLTTERIYSPSVAFCGGATSLTFAWTFDNTGGPDPDCDEFRLLDYVFHMQPLYDSGPHACANFMNSFVCPGPVPVEPSTWGMIKSAYRN